MRGAIGHLALRAPLLSCLVAASALTGCSDVLTRGERLDPQSCSGCHPDVYKEWSGSMHAYASVDPVFRAMNARGQRETDGRLGDFCVKCHAPMALAEGATTDGTNLDTVDAHLQGVTCIFCHSIDAVTGTHNAAVRRADDGIMRGGIADPIDTPAHPSQYSALHDRNTLESSQICGACHDVTLPNGHALERSFAEWKGTVFASETSAQRLSCQGCHMPGSDGPVAAVEGAPVRRRKSHMFPAVDVAITPFPERDAQRAAVERELATVLNAQLCVIPAPGGGANIDVVIDNVAAGHSFPSGVAHDRRAWLEVIATRGDRTLLRTGTVADGQPVAHLDDPSLLLLRDEALEADGTEALMFWEVERSVPNLLKGTRDPLDPTDVEHYRKVRFPVASLPDRVTMRMRMRPMGLEVVQSLIDTGDLDPAHAALLPTYDLGSTKLEWRVEDQGTDFCATRSW